MPEWDVNIKPVHMKCRSSGVTVTGLDLNVEDQSSYSIPRSQVSSGNASHHNCSYATEKCSLRHHRCNCPSPHRQDKFLSSILVLAAIISVHKQQSHTVVDVLPVLANPNGGLPQRNQLIQELVSQRHYYQCPVVQRNTMTKPSSLWQMTTLHSSLVLAEWFAESSLTMLHHPTFLTIEQVQVNNNSQHVHD